jgi:UPF0271 protein
VAVDLNSDVGESYGVWRLGDDAAMLRIVSSANVACGFHGGDPSTLRDTCAAAAAHGVTIGAQVSYPDLAGFGRRFLDMSAGDLRDAVLYQLGALDAFAQVAGREVDYVKPHGALYHATIDNSAQAEAVVAAAAEYDPSLAILGQPDSELLAAAERAGLEAVSEGYVDRAYRSDGRLVPRTEPGALITDADAAAAQAVRIAVDGEVVAVDGEVISLHARSLCVHGDTPGAVAIATATRQALEAAGVGVYAFCG